jgi:hypothetical protein
LKREILQFNALLSVSLGFQLFPVIEISIARREFHEPSYLLLIQFDELWRLQVLTN